MPIRFHCESCSQLLSISRKKAGEPVTCPTCGAETIVPPEEHAAETESPPPFEFAEIPPDVPPPPIQFADWTEDAPEAPDDEAEVEAVVSEPEPSESVATPEPVAEAAVRAEPSSPAEPGRPAEIRDDEPPVFRVRKVRTDFEEMDLTPMVDVTFLLLIFFMLTASFSLQKTIPTPVPEANEQSASQPIQQQDDLLEKSIVIEIDDSNAIFLDEEEVSDPQQLTEFLREKMNRDQKAEVLVDASENAFNETVVFVLDAANDVGMQKIRMTFPKTGSDND